jgi:hypothetical protein
MKMNKNRSDSAPAAVPHHEALYQAAQAILAAHSARGALTPLLVPAVPVFDYCTVGLPPSSVFDRCAIRHKEVLQ